MKGVVYCSKCIHHDHNGRKCTKVAGYEENPYNGEIISEGKLQHIQNNRDGKCPYYEEDTRL